MKSWMSWMLMAAMVVMVCACDEDAGSAEAVCGPQAQAADVFEDDAEEGVEAGACVPQCDSGEVCDAGVCVSECTQCMETECAWEVSACDSNWECPALMQCLSGCGSDSCMETCLYSYYDGADDLLGLLECMDEDCSWEC
jgi:hypothetical protein